MQRLADPQGTGNFLHRHFWHCVFLVGLFVPVLAFAALTSSEQVLAASFTPSKNTFTVSPTQGPVSAVITVSASGVFFTDGTQVKLGYTLDFHTCNLASGGQVSVVRDGAFSGWFRWPATTGIGSFGVCASANSFTFQVGNYKVLSASAPHIAIAPATLQVGKQATVSGTNFLPSGSNVNLIWRSANGGQSIFLGSALSNGSGAFTHTFSVPVHASTGSYTLTGAVGGGSPPALSAVTTFHVSGISLALVPTSTARVAQKTATPTPVPTAPVVAAQHTMPTSTSIGNTAGKTSLLLPIALGGAILVTLALCAGVLVVRRQRRRLTLSAAPTSGPLLWPEAIDMMNGSANNGSGMVAPWPGAMYPGGNSPAGNPGMEYTPFSEIAGLTIAENKAVSIPFDPGLAEAMREAQVSLFATPRPPIGEEVEVQ
ncbi:MAG TPA: hypothetical protein VGD98_26650 [Ktedonobacteraceae bacterium]